jgi:plasmid stabilization system protein ParE
VKTRFLTPARVEFTDAIAHYHEQRKGLGFRFSDEVKITIQRIVEYPEAGSPLSKATRQRQVKRFPYSVIYYLGGDELVIVAVMHNRRAPSSWKNRISEV